jgi:hypothetical protein
MRMSADNVEMIRPFHGKVQTASVDACLEAEGEGTLKLHARKEDGDIGALEFENTLIVPGLLHNLTSVYSMVNAGHVVCFSDQKSGMFLNADRNSFVPFVRDQHLWFLEERQNCQSANSAEVSTSSKISNTQLWHLRLGHVNARYLGLMKDKVKGLSDLPRQLPEFICHCCREAKMRHANQAKESESRAKEPLELIHIDTAGPMKVQGVHAEKYFTTMTDDYSRFRWVYCHRSKSDLLTLFKQFIVDSQAMLIYSRVRAIRRLRSDNGGEYCSREFETYLLDHKIKHEYSNPDEQFQNARAERTIGMVSTMARAMHLTAATPKRLWPFAVKHAVHLLNRIPSRVNDGHITPFELMHGKMPDVSKMKPFGSMLYVYVHRTRSGDWKQDPRGVACAYLGEGEMSGSKASIGIDLQTGAIRYST